MSDQRQYFVIHNTEAEYKTADAVTNNVIHGRGKGAEDLKDPSIIGNPKDYKAHSYIFANPMDTRAPNGKGGDFNLRASESGSVYQIWGYDKKEVSATRLEDVSNISRRDKRADELLKYNVKLDPRINAAKNIAGSDGFTPQYENIDDDPVFGNMVHVEVAYRISPSINQYIVLAEEYLKASSARGQLLSITTHTEVDRGISGAHGDPSNFDFGKFYAALGCVLEQNPDFVAEYGIETRVSEFHNQDWWYNPKRATKNIADMLNQWPPENQSDIILNSNNVRGNVNGNWASSPQTDISPELIEKFREIIKNTANPCFLSGTLISIFNGSSRVIEDISVGDVVLSYDSAGDLRPGRVVRTSRKHVKHILDVFGLMVTPGHATLCGDGRYAGRHVPILDILRTDGALVTREGALVRAGTGCPVGSEEDRFVELVVGEIGMDGHVVARDRGRVRIGTRFITEAGVDLCIADLLRQAGAQVNKDGLVTGPGMETPTPLHLSFLDHMPLPEDYVLQRSCVTLAEIYAASEWEEGASPMLGAPMRLDGGSVRPAQMHELRAMPRNEPLAFRRPAGEAKPSTKH